MDFLWFALIGLIAGSIAKAILPGDTMEPKGCLLTALLGMAGSMLVGFLMPVVFGRQGGGGFIGTLCGATIGAIILLWVYAMATKNK